MLEPRSDDFKPAAASGGAAPATADGQAADSGTGVADARRAGDMPAVAAAPTVEAGWRWAPRPKVDPLTQEPECGWAEARRIQAKRRTAASAAKRLKPRRVREAGLGALIVAKSLDAAAADAERRACPIEQAAGILRRRGFVVYRMSVHGGSSRLWFASCLGKDVTGEQLVAEADRHRGKLGQ